MENNKEKQKNCFLDRCVRENRRRTDYFKKSEEENIRNKLQEGDAAIGCVLFSDVHVLFIFNLLSKIIKKVFFFLVSFFL